MLQKNILVIEENKDMYKVIKELFKKEKEYSVIFCLDNSKDIKEGILNFPDIILINSNNYINTYKEINSCIDSVMIPILVFLDDSKPKVAIENMKMGINLCIPKPVEKEILYYDIKNYIKLVNNNRTVSPLTGLPGNIQITNEIRRRIIRKTDFSVLYCDLDNFKAYNDTYGFVKGDDVIKLTADIILSTVREIGNQDDFLGHIGGDDFIAITSNANVEQMCKGIIEKFDKGILKLLSQLDRERGFFEVPNRRGIIEQYPLTSISIGVVKITKSDKTNPLEIGEIGAQVKHKAKTITGSAYSISKREIYKEG